MLLPLIAFTQADSLKLVPVKAWQLSRLIDETKLYRLCDSTLTKYINALDVSEKLNANNDSIKKELEFSRDTWKDTSLTKDSLLTNQSALQKVELKRAIKKGNKKMVVGSVMGFLAALLLL